MIENHISMIALLGNPDAHHGKSVLVEGFLKVEQEGNCLYLHKEDYERGLGINSIWVDVTEDIEDKLTELDMRYVMLEGTFDSEDKGHFNSCTGAIKKISRAEPVLPRAEFEKLRDQYIDRNLQKLGLGPFGHLKREGK